MSIRKAAGMRLQVLRINILEEYLYMNILKKYLYVNILEEYLYVNILLHSAI